ncbi:MAG TPA: ABC transporter permease [Pirellulales bacterium]|nr:ABC transporter permease [Pirellulales bacterium]
MAAVFSLQVRQILCDRRLLLLALFLCLPVVLAGAIRWGGGFTPGAQPDDEKLGVGIFLFLLYPQAMCELLSLLFASSLVSAEIDGQTLTYLFTRPVPKWRIVVGKYAAMWITLVVPVVASLVVSWMVLGAVGGARLLSGMCLGVGASLLAYGAVFAFIGVVVPNRAMAVGLLYAMIEFALSYVPAVLNNLTVTYYLRSLVARILDVKIPIEAQRIVGGASLSLSCAALAGMVLAALAAASWVVSQAEFVVARGDG